MYLYLLCCSASPFIHLVVVVVVIGRAKPKGQRTEKKIFPFLFGIAFA